MRVGIVGVTGYVGSELARWVLAHPRLELGAAVSRSAAGRPLGEVLPGLAGLTDLRVAALDPEALCALDAVLLATPHGAAAPIAAELDASPRIVDCSADHRHAEGWVYGQPEWSAEALVGATRIAAPGCFATALELSLAPFVAAGLVTGPVRVVAATGSTGSGATPKRGTHHPERLTNLKAYKVLRHQHVPEVRAFLDGLGVAPRLDFVPLSAPVDRGILATCFVPIDPDVDAAAVVRDAYAGAPLVRLRHETPELRHVRGTAFCDLAVHQEGDCAVVLAAIDNLGKGAAAQAVQCLDLAMGWPVDAGLRLAPVTP